MPLHAGSRDTAIMGSPIDLGQALVKHQSELVGLSTSLLDDDTEAFGKGIVELLTSMAAEIPVLGVLAKHGVAKAFASSSSAALQREIAALEREEERRQFAAQIAAPIEELIGQALIQLVRGQQRGSDELLTALGGLRAEFESFRAEFGSRVDAAAVAEATVVVDQLLVSGDGIGIRVTSRTSKSAKIGTLHVSGSGIGIELD